MNNYDTFNIFALFFPRMTLLVGHINGWLPMHYGMGYWCQFWMTALIPRMLICIYIIQNAGVNSLWFYLQLTVIFLSLFKTNGYFNNTK